MKITQRLSLFWRRFSPLEQQLLAAVGDVLPPPAKPAFDAQVAGITLVQRHPHWTEIFFYRRVYGKVNWSGIPTFPRTGEFPLAEVRFTAGGQRFKATLSSIGGHIFDFLITPGAKAVAFNVWDPTPSTRLLADPLIVDARHTPEPIPAAWQEFLSGRPPSVATDWKLHDTHSACRIAFDQGEFLILAERAGGEFILHRLEPLAASLFYLRSHDGIPGPIEGTIGEIFQKIKSGNL